jgi:hypothetical protein
MSRLQPFAVALAAVTLCSSASIATAASVGPVRTSSDPRPSASGFELFNDGIFGCRITFNARNESSADVIIKLSESRSRVKVPGPISVPAPWDRWNNEPDWTVNTGGSAESKIVELSMPCNAGDRQYEIMMRRSGSERIVRFPADNRDYTDQTTIGLGNVGRHF